MKEWYEKAERKRGKSKKVTVSTELFLLKVVFSLVAFIGKGTFICVYAHCACLSS